MLNILCIIDGDCPSITIALRQPLGYLESAGGLGYSIVKVADVTESDICNATHVIFARSVDPENLYWLDRAISHDKKILYFIDDNFCAMPEDSFEKRFYSSPLRLKTISILLDTADLVILGSLVMREEMDISVDRSVCLPFPHPNFPTLAVPSRQSITIGYAGTVSHKKDFVYVIPALISMVKSFPGEIRVDICGTNLYSDLAPIKNHITIIPYDYDYDRFITGLTCRNWSFGLAPLLDSPSNRCKTYVKYRDYAAGGIPGIYSNILPYSTRVRHMETGLLVDNTEDAWEKALRLLASDHELRDRIRARALADIKRNNSIQVVAKLWMSDVFERLDDMPPIKRDRNIYTQIEHYWIHKLCRVKSTMKNHLRNNLPSCITEKYRQWKMNDV